MKAIKIFDSYIKKLVEIDSSNTVENGKIKMYSCGPTVYKYQHIGNLRAAWLPDTFAKIARISGWNIDWVLNITDVGHLVGDGDHGEDKLEKSAKQENKTPEQIVNFYTRDYLNQVKSIGLDIPTGKMLPKATEYIESQMKLALRLVSKNLAYVENDGIYFDSFVSKNLEVPFNIENTGSNDFTDRNTKGSNRSEADFAIWKFVNENTLQKWKFNQFDSLAEVIASVLLQSNDSKILDLPNRWGVPGWHSECVVMICDLLGNGLDCEVTEESIVDVHFGGEDHIDVHHKNEILQSKSLHIELSKNWVHNKFVTVDGTKMSKSLGNVFLAVGDPSITNLESIISSGFETLAYRLMLFEHHYNNTLNFTWNKLKQSQVRLHNLRKECAKISSFLTHNNLKLANIENIKPNQELLEILCENLDTPKFLESFSNLVSKISQRISQNNSINQKDVEQLWFWENNLLKLSLFPEIEKSVLNKLAQRQIYKTDKNYLEADRIRGDLFLENYVIEDYSWGSGVWKNLSRNLSKLK